MQLRFTETNPFEGPNVYSATNEEPILFMQMLNGQPLHDVAGVSSGGEMPLLLLGRCTGDFYAVDHSKKSLHVAMLKVLLLAKLGSAGMTDLFINNASKFAEATKELRSDLPESVRESTHSIDYAAAAREWLCMPPDTIAKAYERLDRLHFIHGDVRDVAQIAPTVDLFYASNVHDGHTDREQKYVTLGMLAPLVRDGGSLLYSGSTVIKGLEPWTVSKSLSGYRTSWRHNLCRKGHTVGAAVNASTTQSAVN